jgi:hypothetical protein
VHLAYQRGILDRYQDRSEWEEAARSAREYAAGVVTQGRRG